MIGSGKAGAVVIELVLQDSLKADDVADKEITLKFIWEMSAGEDFHAGAGAGSLLIDLWRTGVLLREIKSPGKERSVVRLRAGPVEDEVLPPGIEDVAVRVSEGVSDVDLE